MTQHLRKVGAFAATIVLGVSLLAVRTPEVAFGAPATTQDQAFVIAAYNDFLGRAPTSGELTAATAKSLSSEVARSGIVTGLAYSPEWVAVTVSKLYQDTLGRAPDATGLAYWIGRLRSGSTTVAQAAANFYSSTEYFNGFGNGSTTTWIADLYSKILHRSVDAAGSNYWVSATATRGRWWVAYSMYQSPESCHSRVANLYQKLLGRSPDQNGWDFWAGQIKVKGDLVLAAQLAASNEYYQRAWDRYGPPVPGKPTGVRATASDMQATVSWVAPNIAGDSPISGYTATATPGGKSCSTMGALQCTVTGLSDGVAYTFTVQAANSFGLSRPSDPSGSVTPQPNFNGTWSKMPAVNVSENWSPSGISGAGLIVGLTDTGHYATCTNPCTAPQELLLPSGYRRAVFDQGYQFTTVGTSIASAERIEARNAAKLGAIVGATRSEDDGPVTIPELASATINISANGTIVATAIDANGVGQGLVWSSPTASPTVLSLPSQATGIASVNIAPNGTIFGAVYFPPTDPNGTFLASVVWTSPGASPVILKSPGAGDGVPIVGVTNSGTIIGMGISAVVIAGSGSVSSPSPSSWVVWSSPTATPTLVPLPAGISNVNGADVSPSGALLGMGFDSLGAEHLLMWPSPQSTPVTVALPPNLSSVESPSFQSGTGIVALVVNQSNSVTSWTWASASGQPTPLAEPSGPAQIYNVKGSASGIILGISIDATGASQGLVWSSPTAQPTTLGTVTVAETPHIDASMPGGKLVGTAGPLTLLWNSPNDANPSTISIPTGYFGVRIVGANATGTMIATATSPTGMEQGLVWSSPSAQPTILSVPNTIGSVELSGISAAGVIVGMGESAVTAMGSNTPVDSAYQPLVWTSASAQPTVLNVPSTYSGVQITSISPSGLIVGTAYDASYNSVALAWPTPSSQPIKLTLPSGMATFDTLEASSSGAIVGLGEATSSASIGLVWSSPTAQPVLLNIPGGMVIDTVHGITTSGWIVATTFTGGGAMISVWASAQGIPTVLPLPVGITLAGVEHFDESGEVIISGADDSTWVYAP